MIYNKSRYLFLSILILSASFLDAKEEEKDLTLQEEITEYIYHHVQDSHDFSLFSTKDKKTGKKKYYGFPLPVILIDDGVKFFMSSKLDLGNTINSIMAKSMRQTQRDIFHMMKREMLPIQCHLTCQLQRVFSQFY
jgi:hypothetical protein